MLQQQLCPEQAVPYEQQQQQPQQLRSISFKSCNRPATAATIYKQQQCNNGETNVAMRNIATLAEAQNVEFVQDDVRNTQWTTASNVAKRKKPLKQYSRNVEAIFLDAESHAVLFTENEQNLQDLVELDSRNCQVIKYIKKTLNENSSKVNNVAIHCETHKFGLAVVSEAVTEVLTKSSFILMKSTNKWNNDIYKINNTLLRKLEREDLKIDTELQQSEKRAKENVEIHRRGQELERNCLDFNNRRRRGRVRSTSSFRAVRRYFSLSPCPRKPTNATFKLRAATTSSTTITTTKTKTKVATTTTTSKKKKKQQTISTPSNVNATENHAIAALSLKHTNANVADAKANGNVKFTKPKAIQDVSDCLFMKFLLLLCSIQKSILICLLSVFIFCVIVFFKCNSTFVYKYFQNFVVQLLTTFMNIKTKATSTAASITIVVTTLLLIQIVANCRRCYHRNKSIAKIIPRAMLLKADQNFYPLSAMMNIKNFATFVTKTTNSFYATLETASAIVATTKLTTKSLSFTKPLNKHRTRLGKSYSNLLLLITCFVLTTNQLCNVAAFKPKSATQKTQHDQQQLDHQQSPPYNVALNGKNVLTPPPYQLIRPSQTSNEDSELLFPSSSANSEEQMFDDNKLQRYNELDEEDVNTGDNSFENKDMNLDKHPNGSVIHFDNATKTPLFPKDLFTKEQLENGAVVCHIIGVIYMFVALAIVCDEFFVPSLDVIIEKLGITDDVAGATFMAAGGSAPELFTSVIGVFVSFDDVGIGTIVGSAVFNILFVIGMCALFSRTVLSLTWWPLFRDCSFYSISLLVLIYFFRDNLIYWWEALILFLIYVAYVTFMKWNIQVESCVKKMISKNKGNAANSSETSMATQPGGSVTSRAASETRSGAHGSNSGPGTTGNTSGSQHTGAKFRHGLLQLMIHTIDPLHDGKVDEKATQLHAIASLKVLLDATKPQRGGATTSAANHVKINLKETTLADRPNGNIDTTLDSPSLSGRRPSWIDQRVKIQTRKFSIKQTNEIEDEPEPLSMAWPDTARKRLTYILVAPLLVPMWLTLPDTRTPRGKRFFPVTFIGSILWIAVFSYLMVWWANVAGDTARIPPEVMGLTFLAAGTSIPDLITSVIVARKGFGDMAVSSSVGSNIFDVTVGLPVPWLLYGLIYNLPVEVNSVGMVCSITILFMMLLFVVMSIACFRWRMNKGLGFTMFLLYFVFVAVSLMFEYDKITCPV